MDVHSWKLRGFFPSDYLNDGYVRHPEKRFQIQLQMTEDELSEAFGVEKRQRLKREIKDSVGRKEEVPEESKDHVLMKLTHKKSLFVFN